VVDAVRELSSLFASRYGLLVVNTRDEARLLSIVGEAAASVGSAFWVWRPSTGLSRNGGAGQVNTSDPRQALAFLDDLRGPSVAVFLDAAPLLADPVALRMLKDQAGVAMAGRCVILSGVDVDPALDGVCLPWRLPPASRDEMRDVVMRTLRGVSHLQIDLPGPDPLVDAVMGLTAAEAERAILREVLADGRLGRQDAANIRRLRAELLSRESPLDLIDPTATLDDVGGLDNLKHWLQVRRRGFEPAARRYGLPAPRGVLLVGVPGCGKSLIAKAVARTWGLPLAALDTGRLHGSLVGESERRMRAALDSVEVMAPVVLWIDEIEKAFGGGAEQDGGVAQRVMGVLLGWLQERPEGVFVIATSNDVQSLPPEILRRGRFDDVFFVDLPDPAHRAEILNGLLSRRSRNPGDFDVAALVKATEGFSGAELDSVVTSALYAAYAAGRDVDDAMLLTEIGRTVPLSRLRGEEIAGLRAWAQQRARPA
jgi:hypothetical protein